MKDNLRDRSMDLSGRSANTVRSSDGLRLFVVPPAVAEPVRDVPSLLVKDGEVDLPLADADASAWETLRTDDDRFLSWTVLG